jgi:GTP cyclohydrolase IB
MTNLTDALHIPDTQSGRDDRRLAIQRVGIKDVRYPLTVQVAGAAQATTAQWDLDVALPADAKGTHMSRFVSWLDALEVPLDASTLREQLGRMLALLGAQEGRIDARFSFFLRKRAPVSGVQSLLDYQGRWIAEARGGASTVWSEVAVPVKSLCPCSKEISDYGAHNQRSLITIGVRPRAPVFLHELLRIGEEAGSAELYGILKRVDEKYVTERAYDNPRFVEDLVRGVAARLATDARFDGFVVEAENFESIHNHSAYARIARGW